MRSVSQSARSPPRSAGHRRVPHTLHREARRRTWPCSAIGPLAAALALALVEALAVVELRLAIAFAFALVGALATRALLVRRRSRRRIGPGHGGEVARWRRARRRKRD